MRLDPSKFLESNLKLMYQLLIRKIKLRNFIKKDANLVFFYTLKHIETKERHKKGLLNQNKTRII